MLLNHLFHTKVYKQNIENQTKIHIPYYENLKNSIINQRKLQAIS